MSDIVVQVVPVGDCDSLIGALSDLRHVESAGDVPGIGESGADGIVLNLPNLDNAALAAVLYSVAKAVRQWLSHRENWLRERTLVDLAERIPNDQVIEAIRYLCAPAPRLPLPPEGDSACEP